MDPFIQEYTKNQSRNYYKKFWANTASANGLTVKYDGKEFLVKLEDIWMEDLGDLVGKCLCGHAIRYQYHVGPVTPVGSTCIQTMTGLSGQDLRLLLKGGDLARQDKEDLLKTIEYYGGSFKKQLETDLILKERYDFLHKEDCVPEEVQKFVEKDCPLPASVKRILYQLFNEKFKFFKVQQSYGQEVYNLALGHEETVAMYRNQQRVPKFIQTVKEIGSKILDLKANPNQVELFKRLAVRAKNIKFLDAYSVLLQLQPYDLGEFWNNLVADYLRKGELYGLTDGQIKLILEKSAAGKPGMAERFADKLSSEFVPTPNPNDYITTPDGDKPIEEDSTNFF